MRARKRIAIMQPYLYPYAGYFRLFAAVDEFVVYDCVQFPRSGRVHRSEIGRRDGGPAWLTLPLARQSRDVRIADLAFASGARAEFDRRLASAGLPSLATGPMAAALMAHLHGPLASVVDFLEAGLACVTHGLRMQVPMLRSSTLGIADDVRGQARILAICAARGATDYVNAPGGRALYAPADFLGEGVTLHVLDGYTGPHMHLLPALLRSEASTLAADIRATCTVSGRAFAR